MLKQGTLYSLREELYPPEPSIEPGTQQVFKKSSRIGQMNK